MKITKEQVGKLAALAQLEFPGEKMEVLGKEMQRILTYVELIGEVETRDVAPTHQVTGFVNSFRVDEPQHSSETLIKAMKENAPDVVQDYVVTPKIFTQEHKTK